MSATLEHLIASACRTAEELGVSVFPVRVEPDPQNPAKTLKRPLIKGWQNGAAVSNPQGIEELLRQHAQAVTHVGIATGRIVVVDFDGEDALAWWGEHADMLPPTRTVDTRRPGGKHLYYRVPPGCELRNSAGKIAPHVDFRGAGGFVVDWSVEHPPAVEEVADAPAALIKFLQGQAAQTGAGAITDDRADGKEHRQEHRVDDGQIREGGRNEYLSREAYRLRRQRTSIGQILIVLGALNTARCVPPLSEDELQQIAGGKARVVPDEAKVAPRAHVLRWSDLEGKQPPARKWILPHWVPDGHPTLLAGRGGIGKTLLAQHIGTALALGADYIEPLEAHNVLMWGGEDDEDEFWRRQIPISSYFQQPLSALTGRFYLHSYAGLDMTLAAPVFGELQPMPLFDELRQQVTDYKAGLVIIDNAARVFGGNENDRHAVTTFLAWLQGACRPAAVLLLSHPARAAGSEFSGSSAWEGAVRARLYLSDRPPDADIDDDAPVEDRFRYLARRKANYSQLDIRRLSLIEGTLIPELAQLERVIRPSGEFNKDIVSRAVTKLAERGIYGSCSNGSTSFLPKLAKQYGLLETVNQQTFAATMRTMVMAGELVSREVGKYSNRTPRMGLVIP